MAARILVGRSAERQRRLQPVFFTLRIRLRHHSHPAARRFQHLLPGNARPAYFCFCFVDVEQRQSSNDLSIQLRELPVR